MDERVIQFRVGVLVVATAIIAGILVILFESRPLLTGQYAVHVRFAEAPGVGVGTPVRKSGILIGRVSAVELTQDGKVTITCRIDRKFNLPASEQCRIATNAILGDSIVEFVSGEQAAPDGKMLGDNDTITGLESSDPLKILASLQKDVTAAVRSIGSAGTEVKELAEKTNRLIDANGEQVTRIIQKTEVVLDRFQRTAQSIDEFVNDPELKAKLKRALNEFPEVLTEARTLVADARGMIQTLNRMSDRAEKNLRNLEGFTKPLGDRGDQLVANLEHSIKAVDQFLSELADFSRTLNSGEGTLGKLVRDREMYDKIESAVSNIQEVSREMKPMIKDARIFADKIARDPGRLGLKGALDRSPTGLK